MLNKNILNIGWITILYIILCSFLKPDYGQNIQGEQVNLAPSVSYTTAELMMPWINPYPDSVKKRNYELGLQEPDRENLPQAPGSLPLPQWPPLPENFNMDSLNSLNSPQTVALSFTGTTLSEAGSFPPDVMGDAGPTQFVVFVNGRIKSFNKTTLVLKDITGRSFALGSVSPEG